MTVQELELTANTVRQDIIKMLVEAGSGHSAGPLGSADIFTTLYFAEMDVDPKDPRKEDRDRFVLSCGHYCPVWYATMASRGFFPREELMTLRKFGTRLQGHPHNMALPGVENSSGPLGQGLSQAIGMAMTARMDKKKWRTYCMTSDGEHNEGQIWEAIMFAGKERLDNLVSIIDRNNIQIDGDTEDVMPLEPLGDKYKAFGWHVIDINGNDIGALMEAYKEADSVRQMPSVIIAHTTPGMGVEFMEDDFKWHGMPPNKEQAKEALHELRTLRGRIRAEHE
ncbi:MAG TPA: transketolase [Gammaproteobacteria bacterium]|nr:transketolase [Gammaproteobacteria bacterium]